MFWPCETRTSTCLSFATISSGLYRFLAIAVLLDVKDIPQVGPLQWGWITGVPGLILRAVVFSLGGDGGKKKAGDLCASLGSFSGPKLQQAGAFPFSAQAPRPPGDLRTGGRDLPRRQSGAS